jgi:hypothetical protein
MRTIVEKLKKIIIRAISEFYDTPADRDLIERDLSERAIVASIYYNMRRLLEKAQASDSELRGLHVDVEYNRNNLNSKYARKEKCNACGTAKCAAKVLYARLEKKGKDAGQIFAEQEKRGMEPDLIIHQRGSNDKNHVVIEFKKRSQKSGRANDFGKLTYFTCNQKFHKHPGEDYNYQQGYFVDLDKWSYKIIPFENGIKSDTVEEYSPPFQE